LSLLFAACSCEIRVGTVEISIGCARAHLILVRQERLAQTKVTYGRLATVRPVSRVLVKRIAIVSHMRRILFIQIAILIGANFLQIKVGDGSTKLLGGTLLLGLVELLEALSELTRCISRSDILTDHIGLSLVILSITPIAGIVQSGIVL
jgi:hypothetical protein